jgi:hypothetical protein
MCGAIHPLPQYAFMAWYLVKHRDDFTCESNTTSILHEAQLDIVSPNFLKKTIFKTLIRDIKQPMDN